MSERPRRGQPAMETFIKREVARKFRTAARFLRESGISNATFYRVVADSPVATDAQFWQLEGALDIPRDVLSYIADVNRPALERAGLEPDQLRVILESLPADLPPQPERRSHSA